VDDMATVLRYWRIVRRWWWLLCAAVLVAGVSSYYGTTQIPRVYRATTTVIVGQSLQAPNPSSQDLYASQQIAQTYVELVKRRPILAGACEALGLDFVLEPEQVTARLVPGTQLLEISVLDTSPTRVRDLANAIAAQLVLATPAGGESVERRAFLGEQLMNLEARIESTAADIVTAQERLESAVSASAIQQAQAGIDALQQKLATLQATYASLLNSAARATNYVSVVEPAIVPDRPISPKVGQTVALSAVIGLTLALAGAFALEWLDDTIRSADELASLTGLPTLGTIGRIPGREDRDRLIAASDPYAPISDAYMLLCSNIVLSDADGPIHTLMVTSAGPSEGKSLTLANLGVAFTRLGRRVLIVDCDFRSPAQHTIFGLESDKGLFDAALHPDKPLEAYAQRTEVENLWLLSAGRTPASPERILSGGYLDRVLVASRSIADVVLMDCPPPLLIADAAMLAPRADAVLLVADLGKARRPMVLKVVAALRRTKANLIGTVVNNVSSGQAGYPYQYYGHYRYGEKRGAPEYSESLAPGRHARETQLHARD